MADNERIYVIEGEDYPSVTTILGATIAKQSILIPWAIKGYHEQASKWLNANEVQGFHSEETRDALMDSRDTEGYKPARIGNVVHHIISQSIHAGWDGNSHLIAAVLAELDSPTTANMGYELREMFADEGLDLDSGPDSSSVSSSLIAWQNWQLDFGIAATDQGQRFIISDTERLVHHRENHVKPDRYGKPLYAGTVDLILTDKQNPKRKYLIDIKTGSLYPDAMYQVAAYANAYNEMSVRQHMTDGVDELGDIPSHQTLQQRWSKVPAIDRCFILQLQREKGKYALKEAKDWIHMYDAGFAKANQWFLTQKAHTLGRQIKPSDFLGEKAAVE